MPQVPFDKYIRYEELTRALEAYRDEFPDWVELGTIGKSHEGREIWIVTLTNRATGSPAEKPAFWCDGNIHASEVSACTAILRLIHTLCTEYGSNPDVTHALDTRTFYLVPRLNPDGAEWALETPPRIIRSSTRPYPYEEDDYYGIEKKDLDGDGRVLSMRVPDPNGAWRVCAADPRLMVRRGPTEREGTFYRLLPEGLLHNWDGMTIRQRKIKEGLDMNRNFPSAWRLEHEQYGAGPFPTSEPEIRAAVSAICERPNICGAVTFHTFSGVHLRPPSRMPDDDIPAEDLWTYQKLGEKGKEMTGYPAISNYHEFRYHPKEVITGVFDDWMYEHRGVYAWTTEIWSPQRQAGITDYKYIDWFREHPEDDDLKLINWSDDKLEGKGHVDWKEFEHPQLGKVEIGGWDFAFAFRNPPPQFLESEVKPLGDWVIWQALCSPKLELRETRVEAIDGSTARVRVAVQNTGWLPTNVSRIAADRKLCRGVVAEIRCAGHEASGEGAASPEWLISGLLRSESGQLVGRNHISASGFGGASNPTDDVAVFEWVLRAGNAYEVRISHERAGAIQVKLDLEAQ